MAVHNMAVVRDLSVLPSPDDTRDHIADSMYAAASVAASPASLDLRQELRPVRDQGSTSTCAA